MADLQALAERMTSGDPALAVGLAIVAVALCLMAFVVLMLGLAR